MLDSDPSSPKQPRSSPLDHIEESNSGPRLLLAVSLLATVIWLVGVYALAPSPNEIPCTLPKGMTVDPKAFREWSWLIILTIVTIFLIGIGHHITGQWRAIFIDDRNKVSLSRLQLVLWTILVLSAFANALVWTVIQAELTLREALALTVPRELLWLMGISTGTLIGAHIIKTDQLEKGQLHTNARNDEADWTDILKSEWNEHEQELDLGKIQMLLFTVILVGGYAAVLFMRFAECDDFEFPALPAEVIGLLGVSQLGYLTAKATQKHARKNRKSETAIEGDKGTKADSNQEADKEKENPTT